jgi:hypothetical protein
MDTVTSNVTDLIKQTKTEVQKSNEEDQDSSKMVS